MKKILTILIFVFAFGNLYSTNYYVKTGGSDAAAGTSDGTAWATIGKVNTEWAAGTFAPGDNIYFRCGDTFNDATLLPDESGTLGSPITISSYGTGDKPLISGWTTISSWTSEGGGIYSASVTCESRPFVVSVDGVNTEMGRSPNSGYTLYDSYSSNNSLTDATLNSSIDNWTGADVVLRINLYATNVRKISSHSGSTIIFAAAASNLQPGFGFYIQNDLETLDTYGEWYHDQSTNTFYMYFGAETPGDHTVRVASRDLGLYAENVSYITVDNLSFEGFSVAAIDLNATPYFILNECNIKFSYYGIRGSRSGGNTSNGCQFTYNDFEDITNAGISIWNANNQHQFTNITISHNTLNRIGLFPGQREPYSYSGIPGINYHYTSGTNTSSIIEYNTLDSIGGIGIRFEVDKTEIRYNKISNYIMSLGDLGGIYTYNGTIGRIGYVHHNIILDGIGSIQGTSTTSAAIAGIYCDNSSVGIRWENNIIAGNDTFYYFGYLGNGNTGGTIKNNTFYDNQRAIRITSSSSHANVDVTGNIFFARTSSQLSIDIDVDLIATCVTDYNYYCSPIDNDASGYIVYNHIGTNLAGLRTARGQDANSADSPTSVSSDDEIHFIYNDSTATKFWTLSAAMVDVANVSYSDTIYLEPFTSLILLGAGTVTEVVEADETATDIVTFTLSEQTGVATINATNHTVAIEVAYTADITNLTPTITLSYGATIYPLSGVSRDFTSPQTYTITALDGTTTQEWVVTVTQEEEPVDPPSEGTQKMVKFGTAIIRL
mgnify:CR=1 FL=1